MDQQVLNDRELIEMVRKTANQIEADKSDKSLILLAEFAGELLKRRVLGKVQFLRLLAPKK